MTLSTATCGGTGGPFFGAHLNPSYKTLECEYKNCGILPGQDEENEIIFNLAIKGLGLCLKKNSGIQSKISILDTLKSMALW